MRDDVERIDIHAPLQVGGDLCQPVRQLVNQEELGALINIVDQCLVVGNAGINEDDAGSHESLPVDGSWEG